MSISNRADGCYHSLLNSSESAGEEEGSGRLATSLMPPPGRRKVLVFYSTAGDHKSCHSLSLQRARRDNLECSPHKEVINVEGNEYAHYRSLHKVHVHPNSSLCSINMYNYYMSIKIEINRKFQSHQGALSSSALLVAAVPMSLPFRKEPKGWTPYCVKP